MIVLTALSAAKRIRREQLQQVVAVGQRLRAEDAVLLRRRDDLAAGLERILLIAQPADEPRRRNARQRLVGVTQFGSHQIEPELGDEATAQVDIRVRLNALKQAVGGNGLDNGKPFRVDIGKAFGELLVGQRIAEDVVV